MIRAEFSYKGNIPVKCSVSGHAGYADAGYDVVCAYVTGAVQTIANSMTEVFQFPVQVEERENAVIIILGEAETDPNAQKCLEGLALQLSELAKVYPKNIRFTKVRCKYHAED